MGAWTQGGRHGAGVVAESSLRDPQAGTRKSKLEFFETSKPAISDTPPPTKS